VILALALVAAVIAETADAVHSTMRKDILIWSVSAVTLLLVLGGAWYYYARTLGGAVTQLATPVSNTPAVLLEKQNQEYALAKSYQKSGDYASALQSYQKALTESQDALQRTQIAFNIAYANELLGKYAEAIAQFKAIAADTSNYAIARAASVQAIGLMYYTYSGSATLQTIASETFKDPPYDSFQDGNSLNMAYTKLFEYAASIYPLAGSEVRIAYGYTNELLDTLKSATTTPQGKEYLALITQSLQATDRDLMRMRDVPEERTLIPEILVREGKTLDRLATLGVVDPQQAEPYFKRGMQYAASLDLKPGSFYALNYALFLADRYGSARSADIKNLLVPFRVGNEAAIYSIVVDFYKNIRLAPSSDKNRKLIILLGQIDPDFKVYLISLGWEQTDFAK
jgi:tetratricopeptide (TPR) repeat protein